jgi:rubredoxin
MNLNPNHSIVICSHVMRNDDIVKFALGDDDNESKVKVTYPWNDQDHVFTGIAPHVALLNDMKLIQSDQQRLIATFVDKVKEALQDYGVNNDSYGEDRIRMVLDQFQEAMLQRFYYHERLQGRDVGGVPIDANVYMENGGHKYTPHPYGGIWHLVPEDWRVPRCGVKDLWRQWWIGDTVRNIPPLRYIKNIDIKHLNNLPIGQEKSHHRPGKYGNRRRRASKTLSDMNYLMKQLTKMVEEANKMATIITIDSVDRMYDVIA